MKARLGNKERSGRGTPYQNQRQKLQNLIKRRQQTEEWLKTEESQYYDFRKSTRRIPSHDLFSENNNSFNLKNSMAAVSRVASSRHVRATRSLLKRNSLLKSMQRSYIKKSVSRGMSKATLKEKQSQKKLQILTGYSSTGNPKTNRNSLKELTRVILHPPYNESTPQPISQPGITSHHVLTISREKLTPQPQPKEARESCIGIQAQFLLTPTRTQQLEFTPSQPAALHRLYRESPDIGSQNINARDISFDYLDSQLGSQIGDGAHVQDSYRKPRHSIDSFIFSSQRVYEAPYGVSGGFQTEGQGDVSHESYILPTQYSGNNRRAKKKEIMMSRLNISEDAFTPKSEAKMKGSKKAKNLQVYQGSHHERLLEQVGNLQKRASPILRASYYDAKHLPLKTFLTKNQTSYKGKWGYLERGKVKEKQAPPEFNLLAELAPAKLASYYKKVYNQQKKK